MHPILIRRTLTIMLAPLALLAACTTTNTAGDAPRVEYLEIVTPQADATCSVLAEIRGVEFGEPIAELGGARLAPLVEGGAGGGSIAVRGPLRPDEAPVVRPYLLVDDLDAAVAAAREAGAEIAIERMPIPGRGAIAIYILGGIEHGLWEAQDEG